MVKIVLTLDFFLILNIFRKSPGIEMLPRIKFPRIEWSVHSAVLYISTSIWSVQHPNAGRNIQQIVVLVKKLSSEKGMFYLAADLNLYLNMLYKYVVH